MMREYLYFDRMITPRIITFVYWLLLVVVVINGLITMTAGAAFGGGASFGSILLGLLMMVVGAVAARIWCELLIILFKIYENTKKMAGVED